MFFILAKILGFFAHPSNLLITLGLIGAVLMATRYARDQHTDCCGLHRLFAELRATGDVDGDAT